MIVHLTHTDLDGAGCAILLQRAGITTPSDTYFLNYDELSDKLGSLPKDIRLFMTDLSVRKKEHKRCLSSFEDLIFLDHHITSLWFREGTIDTEKCGTSLTNDYLKSLGISSEDNDRLSKIIEDRDLWKNTMPESKRLATLMGLLGRDEFISILLDEEVDSVLERYSDLIDEKTRIIEEYVSSATPHIPENREGTECIVFANNFPSEIGARFLNEGFDPVFIVSFEYNKVSVRSRKYDVSKFAEINGGGGHANAAGFPLNEMMVNACSRTLKGYIRGFYKEM